jgi:hypothetical protein
VWREPIGRGMLRGFKLDDFNARKLVPDKERSRLKRNRAIQMLPRCVDLPLDVVNRTQVEVPLKIIRVRYDGPLEC